MRAISLPFFRFLLGLLTLVFLVACASDDPSPKKADEIDTEHLYINNAKIYSFEPNSGNSQTGKSYKQASFNSDTTPLRLNTNEDKQGYEFIVYIDGDDVKIMDYVDTRVFSLSSFSAKICNLYPRPMASDKAFDKIEKIVHHDSSVIVGLILESENCEDVKGGIVREQLILIDFKVKDNLVKYEVDSINEVERAIVTISETMSSSVTTENKLFDGDLLIQYAEVDSKSFGFLGASTSSNEIEFYDEDYELVWSYDAGPNIDAIKVKQFSRTEALVSIDTDLYKLDIESILTATQLSDGEPISSISNVDKLFEQSTYDLPEFEIAPLNYKIIENNVIFAVQVGNTVFTDIDNSLEPINNPGDGANIVRVVPYLLSNSATVIHTEQVNSDQVSVVEKDSDNETTLDTGNKKITMVRVSGDKIYINAFDPEAPSDLSKAEARLYNAATNVDRLEPTIYEYSQFVFLPDARNTTPDITLLSAEISTNDNGDQLASKPSLYAFDSSEKSGRKQFRSSEKGNKVLTDLSFGKFPHAIYLDSVNEPNPEKLDENIFRGSIIDDIHGDLLIESSVNGERVPEKYFFNPSQETTDEDEPSLRRISEIQ